MKKIPHYKKIIPHPAVPGMLSVIVPVFRCKTIAKNLKTIDKYLNQGPYPYEILCVIDGLKGSKDDSAIKAKKVASDNIKVYAYSKNRGKGYAVRFGMARAKGGLIAFIDAGGDLNVSGISLALEHMKWYNADIIVGSKRHKASRVNYPLKRRLLSIVVQLATRFTFGINVSDTQTGLKLFRREVLEQVLPRLVVKRWAFDLEILTVANRLGFKRIYESPVEISYNFDSNVGGTAVLNFTIDYLAIFYRAHILHYYDSEHQALWQDDPQLLMRYK